MNFSLNHKMAILFATMAVLTKSSVLLSAKLAYLFDITISPRGIEFVFLIGFMVVAVSIFFNAIDNLEKVKNKAVEQDLDVENTDKDVTFNFYNAPGSIYIKVAKVILTKKAYSRIMEESILMMQEEYFAYYQQGQKYFAILVKIRFFFVFLFVLGINLPVIRQLVEIKSKVAK